MDLGAYAKIEDLEQIAKDNGIDIPRLRGYRLMKDEACITQDQIKGIQDRCVFEIVENLCEAVPFWDPNTCISTFSTRTLRLTNRYLIKGKDIEGGDCYTGIRWDRIHGKKRKILKYAIKKKQRTIQAQWDAWNRYAGKEGILYVHSRMGGGNWKFYEDKDAIVKQPWFLERVDDWWDNTYCDFYCKVTI